MYSNKINILYVEDDLMLQSVTKRSMSRLCNELLLADNGQVGLELYKEHKSDIVVTDIRMPIMNGIDMIKAIKDINPDQHILITTAHSESDYFMDAIDLQVDGFILKPINIDTLTKKLSKIIKQIQIERELLFHQELTDEITQFQNNLLIVLNKDEEVILANKKFLSFFNIDSEDEFNLKNKNISNLFIKDNNCFYNNECIDWLSKLDNLSNEKERIVSMLNENNEVSNFLISIRYLDSSSRTILIFTEVTNITLETNEFKEKAYNDNLTKIHNRAFFEEVFDEEIINHKQNKTQLSFLILDIDKFKTVNDTYGHDIGDSILVDLAKILKDITRSTDTFARFGGEEFVKILPNTSLENTRKVAEHLRQTVEKHIFVNRLKITCSFGIADFLVDDTKESIIKRADIALYKAKENGRNRIEE